MFSGLKGHPRGIFPQLTAVDQIKVFQSWFVFVGETRRCISTWLTCSAPMGLLTCIHSWGVVSLYSIESKHSWLNTHQTLKQLPTKKEKKKDTH